MHVFVNEKNELVVNDDPMCLTGKAGQSALNEIEAGVSSNPRREAVLAECRQILESAPQRASKQR